MQSFSDLLKRYTERTGISDAELARAVGVRRQTIFRWKEGSVARPRSRDDVLAVGEKLRLAPAEIDELLLAAGFPPQQNLPHTRPTTAIDKIDEADLPPVHRAQSSPPEGGQNERGQTNGERAATATAGDTLSPNRLAGRSKLLGWGISILVLLALLAVVWVARREPLPVAAPGETLVIVGQFTNFTQGEIGFNVAGRIAEPLRKEIERAALTSVRVVTWPDPIRSEAEAQAVLTRSRAWMAIWGEYDSGRVLVRFAQADSATAPPEVESLVASPDELFATINSEIPQEIRYLALLTLGAYYAGDNNYSSARAVLERAYATPPQETDARATLLLRLGLAYQLGEDPSPAKAIGFYTELLDAAPDHLMARYNRGLAWLDRGQSGDWARAVADFDGVLARSPGFLAARVGRGVAYLHRRGPGDDAAAMQDFSYVLERDGQRTMALYNRGLLTIRTGERSFWENDLQQVIELAPEFAGGYSALCWGAVLDAEPEKALPLCDQAVALGAPEALHSRGMAHALAGQFPEAIQDLTAFLDWLEEQPASSPYRAYRGQVQTWLIALRESHNPLTPATLEALRQD